MGWIIASSIVLFFAVLLAGRVAVYFDYNGSLQLKVKYMFIRLIKLPKTKTRKKKPKKIKKKKAKKTAENAEKKPASGAKKGKGSAEESKKKPLVSFKGLPLGEKIDLAKTALSSFGRPLRLLCKSIVFSHLSLNITVGGDDAAKTAIKYGRMNMAVGSALGLISSFFQLKEVDDLNIITDFSAERSEYDCYFEVKMTLFAGIAAAFRLLGALTKLSKASDEKQAKLLRMNKKAS